MNKIKGLLNKLLIIIIIFVALFVSYKIKEFKLEKIWGIENPTFFQVLDFKK